MKNPSVYPYSPDHARQNDELELFHESRKLNQECAQAIDADIKDSNYELYRYDLKTAAKTVMDGYGVDRVAWVLANTIQKQHYDGRYSTANKAWATEFDIPREASSFFSNAHPTLIDGFASHVRAEIEARKPSLMGQLKAAAKQTAEPKSTTKKPNDLEV